MKVTKTPFDGLLIIEPIIHTDGRGYFFESYNERSFSEAGLSFSFVQDNQSWSRASVVRGLHFQAPPLAQVKLVRVLSGAIWDVVVDLRKREPTYGKIFEVELSAENKRQLLVPRGFAHGFSVLSSEAELLYKSDTLYAPELQRGIRFDDPALKIEWKLPAGVTPTVSETDRSWPALEQLPDYF